MPTRQKPHHYSSGKTIPEMNALILEIRADEGGRPSADRLKVQFACCGGEYVYKVSEVRRRIKRTVHPMLCPACVRELHDGGHKQQVTVPFSTGPSWLVPAGSNLEKISYYHDQPHR